MTIEDWRGLGHSGRSYLNVIRDEDNQRVQHAAPTYADLERDKDDQAELDRWWAEICGRAAGSRGKARK